MCTAGFVDDVMSSYNEWNMTESKTTRMFRPVRQVAAPGVTSAVSDCIWLSGEFSVLSLESWGLEPLAVAGLNLLYLRTLRSRVSHAKTAEPIKMPFGGLTHVGPRNHGSHTWESKSDESIRRRRGDKTTMWFFVKII